MDQTKVLEEILKKGRYAITINNGTIEKIVKLQEYQPKFEEVAEQQQEEGGISLESKVTNFMLELGIPTHLKGYTYIRDAIIICYYDDKLDTIRSVTKVLYPQIANKYETTMHRVERGITTAINVLWSRGNQKLLKELFGYTIDIKKGKPTNTQFIARVVDAVRMQ